MTSSFFNFLNFDICQYDAYDQNVSYEAQNSLQFNSKDPNCILTQAPGEEAAFQASRSKKTCVNPFESSFQCNFHYEHLEACDKKIQNFMESISSCSEKIQKQTLRLRILQETATDYNSCGQILDSAHCKIQEAEKQKFQLDLQYQKKLKEFLDQIAKKFVPEVAGEFISVANFVWVQYLKVIEERFSQSELISWAKNLVDSKFSDMVNLLEVTKNICFQKDTSQVFPNFQEAMRGFLNYYIVTVSLVIEQFFENPYLQQEKDEKSSLKRSSSDRGYLSFDQISELEQDIYLGRKLKF